jgi:hypothetical protein
MLIEAFAEIQYGNVKLLEVVEWMGPYVTDVDNLIQNAKGG